jgi:phage host-nuclease inhibitor protein Gam
LKKPGKEWKYPEDEGAFIAFLEKQGLPFIRVKKEINRKAIRQQCSTVNVAFDDVLEVSAVCTVDGVML